MSVFLQPIYTQTVGAGGVSSITFNNIPQGFTDLKLVVSGRSTGNDGPSQMQRVIYFGINGNTVGSNYSISAMFNINGVVSGFTDFQAYATWINSNLSTANIFSNSEIYFYNYTRGRNKVYTTNVVNENSGTPALVLQAAGVFRSNAPITSITLTDIGFVQHSTFTLYGVSSIYDTATPLASTIGTPVDLGGVISIPFTANDSGQGQTADNYSVTTSPSSSTFYSNATPVIVTSPTLGQAYTATVSANNAVGSNASSTSSSVTTSNNFASIATITGSTAASVIFTNIPQYYKHLQIRTLGRGSNASTNDNVLIQYNGDTTGTNYSFHYLNGNGSSASTGNGINQSYALAGFESGANASSNVFGTSITTILDYSSTNKLKAFRSLSGYDSNGNGIVGIYGGGWRTYSPISTISVYYGNLTSNTVIELYGIS